MTRKIKVKNLNNLEVYSSEEIDGESAPEAFYCILEQESWVQSVILSEMGLPIDGSYYFSHPSWQQNGITPRSENTVIQILNNGTHVYNLTLE